MDESICKILISEEEISLATKRIAGEVDEFYGGKNPLAVCILKGSVMFFADLMRQVKTSMEFDFMSVSSYGEGSVSSGELVIKKDLSASPAGRDILIVEDIIDSGFTLLNLRRDLLRRGANSVKIVALLDKRGRRKFPVYPDFCGFEIPDEFVVGYGLDYAERFRALPYIGVLKKEVYS